MPIPVRCTGCGSAMKVADQYAGKRGKCPKCGAAVQVPKIAEAIKPRRQPLAAVPLQTPTPVPVASRAPTSLSSVRPAITSKKRAVPPPWAWVAGSGGAVIVLLLVIGFLRDSPSSTVPSAPDDQLASTLDNVFEEPDEGLPIVGAGTSSNASSIHNLVPVSASVDLLSDHRQAKVARTLDDVVRAIVKFEIPQSDGSMITGTGFLIDSRGWVATNYHVSAKLTTAARAKFNDGRKVAIEGTIARAPERDLAIVKLREMPPDALLLDIGYRDSPRVGSKAYAYGHPLNNEFSLVQGIVSRVLTTADLDAQQAAGGDALSRLGAPPTQLWIQTDATVLQGNSGGPLMDEQCRVIGVNTLANLDARCGFASHVKYLKMLADRASGEVAPLKTPAERATDKKSVPVRKQRSPQELKPTKENLRKLFDEAAAFDWKPKNQSDYDTLADLALILNLCKDPKVAFEVSDLAEQLFIKMKALSWPKDRVKAINKYVADQAPQAGRGVVFAGVIVQTVVVTPSNKTAMIIYVPGVSDLFLVPLDDDALTFNPGTELMIFGVILPQTKAAKVNKEKKTRTIRFIRTYHTLAI